MHDLSVLFRVGAAGVSRLYHTETPAHITSVWQEAGVLAETKAIRTQTTAMLLLWT